MANAPGMSRGCQQCRQRRKKCGLEEPTCRRCLSRGANCSGPVPSNLRIYVHRNSNNLTTQSHRGAFWAAARRRTTTHAETEILTLTTTPTRDSPVAAKPKLKPSIALARQLHIFETSVLRSGIPLTSKPTQLFYATMLEAFEPGLHTGIFSADRIGEGERFHSNVALCIRGLLPLALAGQRTLDMSIFSLLTMYVGRLIGNVEMEDLARSAYTSAMGDFRLFLSNAFARDTSSFRIDQCQLALSLCTTMALFEFVNEPEEPRTAFLTHYEGMLNLLELSGPEVFQLPPLLKSFVGLRGIIVSLSVTLEFRFNVMEAFIALGKRRPTILAEPAWIQTPFQFHSKTHRERLQDIVLQIPALLFDVDTVISDLSASQLDHARRASNQPLLEAPTRLLSRLSEVRTELEVWLESFKQSYSTPLWWTAGDSKDDTAQQSQDSECIPDFRDPSCQLRFPDGQKAGMLTTYWSAMLELLAATIDVQTELMNLPNANTNAEPLALSHDLQANKVQADQTASLVLQAMPCLLSCLEGRLAAQLPLQSVARYYTGHHHSLNPEQLSRHALLRTFLGDSKGCLEMCIRTQEVAPYISHQ